MGSYGAHLQTVIDSRDKRIEELEALVERLPKTADGVPVVPGSSKVWRNVNGKAEKSSNWDGWGVQFACDIDWNDNDSRWICHCTSDCFSSEAVANQQKVTKDGVRINPHTRLFYVKGDTWWIGGRESDLVRQNVEVEDCYADEKLAEEAAKQQKEESNERSN